MIWDNHNRSLQFRSDILNLHSLNDEQLSTLENNLVESELDDYMPISELIGIAFDENSVWGQLTIGELKCLINLSLKRFEQAKDFVEMFMTFNDNLPERRRYYQALNIALDITISDELEMDDYLPSLNRMYGEELMNTVLETISTEICFYGLTPTNMQLDGLEKHQRLIESYEKLQVAKREYLQKE